MKVEIETSDVDVVKAWAARAELRRLAEWLCKIYPRWIAEKKTTKADADLKMAALGSAIILADAACTALEAAGAAAQTPVDLPAFSLGKVTAADREMRSQCRFCKSFGIEKRTEGSPNKTYICPLPACPGALAPVSRDIFEGSPA